MRSNAFFLRQNLKKAQSRHHCICFQTFQLKNEKGRKVTKPVIQLHSC